MALHSFANADIMVKMVVPTPGNLDFMVFGYKVISQNNIAIREDKKKHVSCAHKAKQELLWEAPVYFEERLVHYIQPGLSDIFPVWYSQMAIIIINNNAMPKE